LLREVRQGALRLGLLAWLGTAPALAAAGLPPVELGPSGGLRVDGREAMLADVFVPRPVTSEVPAALQVGEKRGVDRWGRERIVVVDEAGLPLAERWVAAGLAVVDPDADGKAVARLLQLEAAARAAKIGIWGQPRWRVQPAERVRGAVGDLVLVAGRVLAVGWAGERLYLNFGEDRRDDFTARIDRADVRALAKAGIELEASAGREVRLRGWLFYLGGPMIELAGPAQIEVLP
jgi:hypothetical protein